MYAIDVRRTSFEQYKDSNCMQILYEKVNKKAVCYLNDAEYVLTGKIFTSGTFN